MENIILTVHLLLALALIISVLLQRSEGGGLGIGGGGGGTMSGRPPASPMAKFTWMLAIAFIVTSLALTYFATQSSTGASVIDQLSDDEGALTPPATAPALPPALGGDLTPPTATDGPVVPPSE